MSSLQLQNRFILRLVLENIKWRRAAPEVMFLYKVTYMTFVRQLEMTLPLGRKDKHGVAFTLINLGLGNVNKNSLPRVYNQDS